MLIFYLREALHSFKKTKLFSFFTTISLSIALLFITASILLFFASNRIDENLKKRIEANVFLNDLVDNSSINEIKANIEQNEFVLETRFVSKDDAMQEFIQETGRDFKSLLDVNPLPQYIEVKFNKNIDEATLQNFIQKLTNVSGVSDVVIDYNLAITILNFIYSGKLLLFIITMFLVLISIYLVYASSKIYVHHQSIQFNTMKLVGAKLSTLKIPLIIRGLILGFMSAIIAIIISNVIFITFRNFYPQIQFVNILYFINFMLIVLGLILGPIGTGIFSKGLSLKIDNKAYK